MDAIRILLDEFTYLETEHAVSESCGRCLRGRSPALWRIYDAQSKYHLGEFIYLPLSTVLICPTCGDILEWKSFA